MSIKRAEAYLQKYFGYARFREGQRQVIERILKKQDTFAVMPTGGGKSICYQIPALLLKGITLVISPLISLMKDQVDSLKQVGIPATAINSSLSWAEGERRLAKARQGVYRLLYIAPERLESASFLKALQRLTISLVAIDEAHCISTWGHDFRPSYRLIPQMLEKLSPKPVIVALTATATPEVRRDIHQLFSIPTENAYIASFERKNLIFSVRRDLDRRQFILDYVQKRKNQAGIIYTSSRRKVDQLYHYLTEHGIQAAKYHAGMNDEQRRVAQEQFAYDRVQVMVATSAFGMGIDKSNIRYVIHYHLPRDLESYYQEAGRAGRDGLASDCILLYQPKDLHIHRYHIEHEVRPERQQYERKKLRMMDQYGRTTACLSKTLIRYFGEELAEDCGRCSNCYQREHGEKVDFTLEAQKVFSCIKRMRERYGLGMVAKVLVGSKSKQVKRFGLDRLSTYGVLSEYTQKKVLSLCQSLVSEGYIEIGSPSTSLPIARLTAKAYGVLRGIKRVFLYDQQQQISFGSEDSKMESCFEKLRQLRKQLAEQEGIPPYLVFHDSVLIEMCRVLPTSRAELQQIKGIGEQKLEKYAAPFLKVLIEEKQKQQENSLTAPTVVQTSSLDQIRKFYRNAYRPWTPDEERRLIELFRNGRSIREIAQVLGRQVGGIQSRLQKLGFIQHKDRESL